MIQRPQQFDNPYAKSLRRLFVRSPIAPSLLAGLLVVWIGRQTLGSTSSTLIGWTALFFTSVYVSLIVFHLRSFKVSISRGQTGLIVLGGLLSICSLCLLEMRHDSAGESLVLFSAILLILSFFNLSRTARGLHNFQAPFLTRWAFRLDDLLKYELPCETRSAITGLIDKLWESPSDRRDFIPAQDAEFENLLKTLESTVRQDGNADVSPLLNSLSKCLEGRNALLAKSINIEYTKISESHKKIYHEEKPWISHNH